MNEVNEGGRHVSAEVIAAYLDGRLAPDETGRVRRHLVTCDECRADVVAIAGAIDHVYGRRRRSLVVPAVAAAAVATLLFIGGPLIRSSDEAPMLRGPDQAEVTLNGGTIAIVSPGADELVAFGELFLTWRSVAADAMYVITVTDAGGDPLWTAETRDTLALLPTTVVLEPGSTYLWYVDALLPDGRSATTGVRRFRTAP